MPWVSEILTQHAVFLQGVHQNGEQSGFKPKQSGFKPGCHWGIAGWPWPTHVQGTHFSIYKRGRIICAFKSLWKITQCNLALRIVHNNSAKQFQRSDQLYSMVVVKGTPRGSTKQEVLVRRRRMQQGRHWREKREDCFRAGTLFWKKDRVYHAGYLFFPWSGAWC